MTTPMDFGDGLRWTKASRSDSNGGACVYVARNPGNGMIGVRDSKEGAAGAPQWYTRDEWTAFLDGVKAGEFDNI